MTTVSVDDPTYRAAVVDLLAALAYGELSAFERLAADAALAPTLEATVVMARMATAEFGHYERLADHLRDDLGVDPYTAMQDFREPIDTFHASTAPNSWLEGLVKAYVGDGIGADFYREIAKILDPETAELVSEVLADLGQNEFIVAQVREATAADPKVGGRLALWARRLVGEALAQAQVVAAERDSFTALFMGTEDTEGLGLGGIATIFDTVVTRHKQRMAALGLAA
jgi:hypothetical protein